MIHLKIYLLCGDADQFSERIEALKKAFGNALGMVDDASELAKYLIKSSGSGLGLTTYNCTVATVGSSVFLVAGNGTSRHGNIILEGLVIKLDTLTKLSAFMLAKMDYDENTLPKMLRGSIAEMKEFLNRK